MPSSTFADRSEAGRMLARALARKNLADPVVLALPRGGVPVAAEIARRLRAPLDVVLVRKIGVPHQRELAAAAVVDGGDAEIVTNDDVMAAADLTRADVERLAKRELAEIERRRRAYLQGRERVPLEGRTLILVDDGIATGASVRAALVGLRRRRPRALLLAVPVAPADTIAALRSEVDDVVCLRMPEPFVAIGLYYRDFHQLSDEDVMRALAQRGGAGPAGGSKDAMG
ncbi:MAG TPA: phosphoribosyltransferase family protein [Hyphomicrobiaceae bacterium]|jgi:putative phosphoribosyl transferase|nr:phosphoribosyltransferase family protein [Hyphomicrobiaceae bacterium]